jgi:hypothetical protein
MLLLYLCIAIIFAFLIAYDSIIYFLDRIVISNKRVVHINWKSLFQREETEADLSEIQDIKTTEFGVLSSFRLFDYGTFRVETASSKVSIIFNNANDPEGIKHFIYHLQTKPTRITDENSQPQMYDRANDQKDPAVSISRPGSG